MSKKNKKVEDYLLNKIECLKEKLCLQGYHDPKVTYVKEIDKGFMQIEDNYPYRYINIRYSDDVIKAFNEGETALIDRCLTHELFHVTLSHFYSKAATRSTSKEIDDALEDTVEHMTRIFTVCTKKKAPQKKGR